MSSRTQGILDRLSDAPKFGDVRWILGDGVLTNYMQSFVDETMQANAEFQSKAGVQPKIVRKSPGWCCEWCAKLEGEYLYPDEVPDDVYHRHDNCDCIVEFYPGDGRKQSVWGRRDEWKPAEDAKTLKIRRIFGIQTKPAQPIATSDVAIKAKKNKIAENKPKRLNNQLSEDEIINKVAGGDMTDGSCASAGFAYVGNKAGFDVLDFRGGASQEFFSKTSTLKMIAKETNGVVVRKKSDFTNANVLLKEVKPGKEYYMTAGKHAAIVRLNNGVYEYLELQSSTNNGFKELNRNVLKKRWGCQKSHTKLGIRYGIEDLIIDIDELIKYDGFEEILGFINTDEGLQLKGSAGNIK